jgi:hypothetical protein
MQVQILVGWVKTNPKLAAVAWTIVVMAFGTLTGWQLTARTAQPGEQPGIVIILPDDFPDVFGEMPNVVGADEVGLSADGKRALRAGGGQLRERFDERSQLFAMFRDIHNDSKAIAHYEQQASTAVKLDPATVTLATKIAVKVAIAVLERTAANSRTEWDNRLLALLKFIDQSPFLITPRPLT